MNITIEPGKLSGIIPVIPSKSVAHRVLICAAFADSETRICLNEVNADIEATANCLRALGADIQITAEGYLISPVKKIPGKAVLPCAESGSTLRFLLPVVGALGVDATFLTEGRLGMRPLSPLWEEMERMGCTLWRENSTIRCKGKLKSGEYRIAGNVSSQFISGLLFAGVLMDEGISICILGNPESKPYITLTLEALMTFGVMAEGLQVAGCSAFHSPGCIDVDGDWSNGAFFLTAKALGSDVTVTGLQEDSVQGDRAILACLSEMVHNTCINASDIPDLIPILSIYAAANKGTVFTNIQRLRLKESDRVESVIRMIKSLGGSASATDSTLTIIGTGLTGGTVDSYSDHRIAMAAAIGATVCKEKVTILGAEAVNKSYPRFWKDYRKLGGNYEQYIW